VSQSQLQQQTWELERGAALREDGSVHFAVWAPNAAAVSVRIHGGPAAGEHELERGEEPRGLWAGTVADVGAGADYTLLLRSNGKGRKGETREVPDPVSRWQPQGVHGPSRVVDPHAFDWSDGDWRGVSMAELVIYELHVGTFTAEGTFESAIPRLRALRELGVTAIEIMPVAEFPGGRNWGYDGVDLYAPQSTYGGPEGLKRLVDAAHREGLAVILDVVYNHVGPEGNYLDSFGPYFTEAYRTPWGRAVNYDGPGSDEVRRFVLDNARYWVHEYHVDGLRLDAVHGIFDFGAVHLLQELATLVHEDAARLGRTVVVIGESDLNDPKLLREPEQGGYGLDGQWSDDFHHAVHAAITGEREGYYSDFGDASLIAESLRDPFVYGGRYSPHRQRRHGAPSGGLEREHFVVAIQNHDQVGNRATGDRLSQVLQPDQLRLSAALLLLSGYVPLIFMGQEYGERRPFQYFVSHSDEQLVNAVREGRRKEFEAFGWGDEVPDPQAESTFEASKLDWQCLDQREHAQMLALYRDLLTLRREEPGLRPDGAALEVTHGEGWIRVLYHPRGEVNAQRGATLLALFNCSGAEQRVPLLAGHWQLRLSTDAAGYGGRERVAASAVLEPAAARGLVAHPSATVTLPAWSAALFVREG